MIKLLNPLYEIISTGLTDPGIVGVDPSDLKSKFSCLSLSVVTLTTDS